MDWKAATGRKKGQDVIHLNWFLSPSRFTNLTSFKDKCVQVCCLTPGICAHFEHAIRSACMKSSMMSNHNFPGDLCCNNMEDLNSSEWKAAFAEQHWLLNCRTELIWNALRRRMREMAFFLLKCCSQNAAHKYYDCIICCVFSITFVIPTVYNIQSEMKLSFVLYSVYWISICIMYKTRSVLRWPWNATDW